MDETHKQNGAVTSLVTPTAAPPATRKHRRHGVFSWCAAGRVPLKVKGGKHLRTVLRALRRGLLLEAESVHGRPATQLEQGLIASAVRHEGRARLLEMVIQRDWEALAVPERVSILREIGAASDSRDRCIKAIGLDKRPEPLPPSLAAFLNSLPPEPPAGQLAQAAAIPEVPHGG